MQAQPSGPAPHLPRPPRLDESALTSYEDALWLSRGGLHHLLLAPSLSLPCPRASMGPRDTHPVLCGQFPHAFKHPRGRAAGAPLPSRGHSWERASEASCTSPCATSQPAHGDEGNDPASKPHLTACLRRRPAAPVVSAWGLQGKGLWLGVGCPGRLLGHVLGISAGGREREEEGGRVEGEGPATRLQPLRAPPSILMCERPSRSHSGRKCSCPCTAVSPSMAGHIPTGGPTTL